jgi:hypothetical protein
MNEIDSALAWVHANQQLEEFNKLHNKVKPRYRYCNEHKIWAEYAYDYFTQTWGKALCWKCYCRKIYNDYSAYVDHIGCPLLKQQRGTVDD